MLKCTALIEREEYTERARMVVPVLPLRNDWVSIGDETFIVKIIETVISNETGDTIAINIHLVPRDES